MPIKPLPIIGSYDKQRFTQYSPADVANWYLVQSPTGKKGYSLYPTLGRAHINIDGLNVLIFDQQPRKIFKSIDFLYVVVENQIFQVNRQWNSLVISDATFTQRTGDLFFDYLPVIQTPGVGTTTQHVFCMFCTGEDVFVIDEQNTTTPFTKVTDPNKPISPLIPVAFGNRFAVSSRNSTQFQLTQINMGGTYNANTVFTVPGDTPQVFAQESGIIRQMKVLQNQLYIFTDFTTGIWSNNPSTFSSGSAVTIFPWRKNTSFQFNYGISDPNSIDVDFGMMVWLTKNRNGLPTFVMSNGQSPVPISTKAISVLIQNIANAQVTSNLLQNNTIGFLYQYEDTIFYRVSIGAYLDYKTIDDASNAVCLEYNFETKSWHRVTELNGQRSLVEDHEFFNNKHVVIARTQKALYEMSGKYYYNELINPDAVYSQDPNYFFAYPFRYENTTPIIAEDDYSEFITDYVEIDFVYGQNSYIPWANGFSNAVFIIAELPAPDGTPQYLISEDGKFFIVKEGTSIPVLDSTIYSDLFKPHIELYVSDDGGISFYPVDVLEFSPLGNYQWRMRWYQCGPSRNRVYRLVAVSPSPIVILGGVMNVRRASGGAN